MNYEGPGLYRHYKGGLYTALGIGQNEASSERYVVYVSHSEEHTLERAEHGVDFVCRALDRDDGPDPWNSRVRVGGPEDHTVEYVPRFRKVIP